jgi:hypothetical protein
LSAACSLTLVSFMSPPVTNIALLQRPSRVHLYERHST